MFYNHDEVGGIAPIRLTSDNWGDFDHREYIPGLPFTTSMIVDKTINFFMPPFICL